MQINKFIRTTVEADLSALAGFSALQMNKLNSIIAPVRGADAFSFTLNAEI
jgi:hypothetical protein